jgi:hypothetical protein
VGTFLIAHSSKHLEMHSVCAALCDCPQKLAPDVAHVLCPNSGYPSFFNTELEMLP